MDEKISNLFNSWSTLKERVRSKIPERYTEAMENMKINKGRRDEHEMGTFKSFDKPAGYQGEYQEGTDLSNGYYGPGEQIPGQAQFDIHTGTSGKISAWQAGWNVTNAIQVGFSFSYLSTKHFLSF